MCCSLQRKKKTICYLAFGFLSIYDPKAILDSMPISKETIGNLLVLLFQQILSPLIIETN